jgi:hypothetical protein
MSDIEVEIVEPEEPPQPGAPLDDLDADNQEALRSIYGDALDVVIESDDDLDGSEPQDALCCDDEAVDG